MIAPSNRSSDCDELVIARIFVAFALKTLEIELLEWTSNDDSMGFANRVLRFESNALREYLF